MTVTPTFEATGSILADTSRHRLTDIATTLEITSGADTADLRKLVATAERMCFMMSALQEPHTVRQQTIINGMTIAV